MSVYEQSISNGFRLHEEFIAEDSLSCKYKNYNEFKIKLLHMDLRKRPCLNQYFPPELNNQSTDTNLVGSVVLQIVSIVNIAQPSKRKYDESNPRLLEIQLSDGHIKVHAIEIEYLSDIKASTPPGTKLLYHGGKVVKGKLLLQPSNCEFLGGGVSHLFEAYQANVNAMRFRSIQRSGSKSKANTLAAKSALDPPRFELKLISHPASTLLLSTTANNTTAPPSASLTNSAVVAEPTANKGNSALKGGKGKTVPGASGSVNVTSASTERTLRQRTPRERNMAKEPKAEQTSQLQEASQQRSVDGNSVVREKTPRERLPPNNQQQQQQQQQQFTNQQSSLHSQHHPSAHDDGRGGRGGGGGRGGAAVRGRGTAGDDNTTAGGHHQASRDSDSLHKMPTGSQAIDSIPVHDATATVSKMSLNHLSSQPTNAVQLTAPTTVISVSVDTATSATKGVFRQLDKPQQGAREETSDAQYFRGRGGGRGRGRGRRGRDFEGTDEGDGAEPKAAPLSVFEAALLTATISNTAHKGNKSHGSASKSSGLKAKGSGSSGLPWGCKVCTYMNHCDLMSCEICEAPK